MTHTEVMTEACAIISLAYHSIGDYTFANDGFCARCRGDVPTCSYRNDGKALEFVRLAVVEKLNRDGIKIADGFDKTTGKDLYEEPTPNKGTMSNIAKQDNPINSLRTMLEQASGKLAEVAPKHLKVERIIRLMLSAASRNPKILECTQSSVLQFCMTCSQTGLEPVGAGGIWPVPYGKELTALIDYRGMVNVAKRAGCIKDAWAENVYNEDEFDYELGLNPTLTHKPARGDRGKLESSYCVMLFPDDTKRFIVMSADEIEGIRKRSRAGTSGPWVTDPGEMAKKTVIRRAMKPFAGSSKEMDAAIAADDAATGLKNVTEQRAPVPMPKPISDEPLPMEQEATAKESVAPTPEPEPKDAPATPKREEAAAPANPDHKTFTGKILGVNKGAGKAPWSIVTELEDGSAGPKLQTFDGGLAANAEGFGAGGEPVTITYTIETNGKYTNNTLQKIERKD